MSGAYNQKLVLITGGSSGIGLALAKIMAAEGADIWILARGADQLRESEAQIRQVCRQPDQRTGTLIANVAEREQVTQVLEQFATTVGTPDYLFNCAGVAHPGEFESINLDIFDWMMKVNFQGTVNVIKALLPGMIQRKSGHIVNFSSLAGLLGTYGYTAYGASKFAVRGFSDVLKVELKPSGLKVSVVFPPDTQTPQLDYENKYKPPITCELDKSAKTLSAEVVAGTVARGVARGRYIITPGFDATLYYLLTNTFGIVYPVMDFMVDQARKKVNGSNHDRNQ